MAKKTIIDSEYAKKAAEEKLASLGFGKVVLKSIRETDRAFTVRVAGWKNEKWVGKVVIFKDPIPVGRSRVHHSLNVSTTKNRTRKV